MVLWFCLVETLSVLNQIETCMTNLRTYLETPTNVSARSPLCPQNSPPRTYHPQGQAIAAGVDHMLVGPEDATGIVHAEHLSLCCCGG